jgi:hypothetical protein
MIDSSKIQQARNQGYSDSEINDFLSKKEGYSQQINTARNEGYSDGEIVKFLEKKSAPKPMSMGEAAFTTATNPLGFGDEIKAGIAAGVAKLFGGAATQNIDIGDLYREARTSERAKQDKARQDRPLTSFAGQVFSDVGIAGKALGATGLAGQGFGTVVKGGAALGATSALGETEDLTNIPQTLKDVATGTVVGGVLGGAVQQAIPATQSAVGAISQAPKKLLQKITGIDPKAVKTFQDLGIDPTLADVSKSAGLQNFIKDIPVAGKPITEALQKQVNDISGQIQNVVKASAKNPKQMGSQIQKGAQEFKTLANARVSTLYDDLDKFLPEETVIPTNNVLNLTKDPQIQDVVAVGTGDTAKILNRYSNIVDDAGNISYPRLKTFRSVVGAKLDSPMLLGDERAALKRIYGSLSEDMKQAVVNNGGDKALQAFNKANSAFERKINFLEKNIDPIIKAKTPEKVYKLAISGIKDGGTQTKRLMNILKPEQQEYVRASIARDMGLARKGAQSAEANVFDPQKFMAEYSVLKKNGTEKAIFTPEQVTAYNRLNKVVELTKNTEQAGKSNMLLPIASLLSVGIPTAGAGLIPAIGGGRLTANLMTNPKFINWLAVTSQATPKQLPKQLNRLSAITAANPEIREDVLDFVANFGNNNQQENTTE